MIKVSDLSFTYNGSAKNNEKIINNVSFEINRGEFVALLGANGSGKSTLAMLLNGVLHQDAGSITIDGTDITASSGNILSNQKIALLFQNPSEHIVSGSVESDIAFSLENYGVPPEEIREKVDEALTIFGLKEILKKHPRQLSGGEQQKVAFAGVWALKPNYIICDEATTYLDHETRILIIELLKKFIEDGGGVLFITQFPLESLNANKLLLLNNGSIQESDTPSELLKNEKIMNQIGHKVSTQLLLDGLVTDYTSKFI